MDLLRDIKPDWLRKGSLRVDYQETFAPVAKRNSICILLSCAANLGWSTTISLVKNAFLHGNLKEEVYMARIFFSKGKICRLKKALYGLKQSPRAWFDRFSKAMLAFGYKQSNADHTMFIKRNNEKITIFFVDDIVVTGNDPQEVSQLKGYLAKEFQIKDLGKLRYFLGIEVARSNKGIFISQRKYVLDLCLRLWICKRKLVCWVADQLIRQWRLIIH